MNQPASRILRAHLIAEGHVTAPESTSANWPAWLAVLPEQSSSVPLRALAIIDSTGINQGKFASNLEVVNRFAAQILLRSDDYEAGWKKMSDIAAEIDQVLRLTLEEGIYTYDVPNIVRGAIIPLGQDPESSKRRFFFSLNVHFICKETLTST